MATCSMARAGPGQGQAPGVGRKVAFLQNLCLAWVSEDRPTTGTSVCVLQDASLKQAQNKLCG